MCSTPWWSKCYPQITGRQSETDPATGYVSPVELWRLLGSITQHVCKVLCPPYVHAGEVKQIYPSGWDDKKIVSVMNQGFIDHRKK